MTEVQQAALEPTAPPTRRLVGTLATVWRGAITDPVRRGRLRDVSWPYGLRAIVVVGLALYAVAAGLALASSAIRRRGVLDVPNSLALATPDETTWLVAFLLVAALALLHVAALHGPWWAKVLAVTVTGLEMAVWGVAGNGLADPGPAIARTAAAVALMLAFSIWRARRPFAWWEFPVVLAGVGGLVALTLREMSVRSIPYGFSFAPLFVEELVSALGMFVLPAALAAGAAVAEITVGATLLATGMGQRLSRRAWPYGLLAVIVAVRLAQLGAQLAGFDPVEQDWLAIGPAVAMVAAFGGLGWLLIGLARRAGAEVAVAELSEDLGRIGLPIGFAVTALQIPVLMVTAALQILIFVLPAVRSTTFDVALLVDKTIDGFRLLLGVVFVLLAMQLARRGRLNPALLVAGVGVMLVALASRLLTGYRWAVWLDPDSLNLVATAVALAVAGWYLAHRRLSRERAVALAGALVLCALVSGRDFVSDPVGALFGYSGAALVLFGVTWDFLTGSRWANGASRRFPTPVRVLLVLTYSLLTVTLVAYGALIRKPARYADLNGYAELGNLILGTALLAAAFTAVMLAVRQERSLTVEP